MGFSPYGPYPDPNLDLDPNPNLNPPLLFQRLARHGRRRK